MPHKRIRVVFFFWLPEAPIDLNVHIGTAITGASLYTSRVQVVSAVLFTVRKCFWTSDRTGEHMQWTESSELLQVSVEEYFASGKTKHAFKKSLFSYF